MPISLILTPFDHFQLRLALAVKCIPELRVRPNHFTKSLSPCSEWPRRWAWTWTIAKARPPAWAWTSLQDLHSHREKPQEEGPRVLPQKNPVWWENCSLLVSFLQVTSQGESQQRKPSATISGLSVPMGSSLEATFCSCSPKCFHRATLIVSVSTYSGLLLHWSQVRQPSIFF